MTITALPSLVRTSPTFKTEVDLFFGTELPTFSVEAEAARVEINANTVTTTANTATAVAAKDTAVIAAAQAEAIANAPQYNDTSSTSLTIGTGTKVFTVTAGKNWGTGMTLIASSGANSMIGTVTSYSSTTLTLNVTRVVGSGTFSSWIIGLSSAQAIGTGGSVITGDIVLTAYSDSAMSVNPSKHGLYVTLPDATTCSEATYLFSVYNAGDYDYGVKDSTGTQLGWIRARTGAMIGLADNSSAVGVWAYYGLEKTAVTASYTNVSITNTADAVFHRIALDSNRTCFLFGGTSCYAIVYNASTKVWGSATLVRASLGTGRFLGVLSATDQVLVCSNDSTTAMQTVTLTISGEAITVNTPVSTTLAGNWAAYGQLIAVSTSFVLSYSRATTVSAIRAITVSGTVPTVGAESTLAPATTVAATLYASGSVVRTLTAATGGIIVVRPYTVSGSSLSAGTSAQSGVAITGTEFRSFLNGNGNIVCHFGGVNHTACIFKLTGTVEAVSEVTVGNTSVSNLRNDYMQLTASKTVFVYHNATPFYYANILTDTNGTASVGTEISVGTNSASSGISSLTFSSNTARFVVNNTSSLHHISLDCSGVSPVISNVQQIYSASGVNSTPSPSDKYGVRSEKTLIAQDRVHIVGLSQINDLSFTANGIQFNKQLPISGLGLSLFGSVGSASNESFNIESPGTTTGFIIQRVEAAA
jgi:hypothetical protein